MLLRRRHPDDDADVVVEHGPSLAKGPALVVGAILVAFGLASLLKNNDFPSFGASFPNGDVHGTTFLGIEVNGWTAFFAITAGALLMFGAAQHHLAKLMSLVVGLALAACAAIALIDGDILGLAAANGWTELTLGVAAAAMLLNALMPRLTRRREVAAVADDERTPVAEPRRFGRPGPVTEDERVEAEPRTAVLDRDEQPTTPHHRV
jgi:hypothetical protein